MLGGFKKNRPDGHKNAQFSGTLCSLAFEGGQMGVKAKKRFTRT